MLYPVCQHNTNILWSCYQLFLGCEPWRPGVSLWALPGNRRRLQDVSAKNLQKRSRDCLCLCLLVRRTPVSLPLSLSFSSSGRGAGQRRGAAVQQAGVPHWPPSRAVGPDPQLHQPAPGNADTPAASVCQKTARAAAAIPKRNVCGEPTLSSAAVFLSEREFQRRS